MADPTSTAAATIEVPLRRLDTLLAGRSPRLLKIDVEGFERDVLEGATRALADPGLLALLVEIFADHPDQSSVALLRNAGFTPCRYDPWQRALTRDDGGQPGNVLFVRDVPAATARLRDAGPMPILGELV